MTIHAIYENGVFRPIEAVQLPDKCEVELSVLSMNQSHPDKPLLSLADIADQFPDPDSPPDLAENLDHYLYGMPKQS